MKALLLALALTAAGCGAEDLRSNHRPLKAGLYKLWVASEFVEGKATTRGAVNGTFNLDVTQAAGAYELKFWGSGSIGGPFSCKERRVRITLDSDGVLTGARQLANEKCGTSVPSAAILSARYDYQMIGLGDVQERCQLTLASGKKTTYIYYYMPRL